MKTAFRLITVLAVAIPMILLLCFSSIGQSAAAPSAGLPDLAPLSQGIVLGRPTDTSITAHIIVEEDADCFIEYGTDPNKFTHQTEILSATAGEPNAVYIEALDPNTQYFYRLWSRPSDSNVYQSTELYTFHTQRAGGTPFSFGVQSDSHLDEQSVPDLYKITLANELKDVPDFVIDLGDTFVSDKVDPATYEAIEQRYRLQRVSAGGYPTVRGTATESCHEALARCHERFAPIPECARDALAGLSHEPWRLHSAAACHGLPGTD